MATMGNPLSGSVFGGIITSNASYTTGGGDVSTIWGNWVTNVTGSSVTSANVTYTIDPVQTIWPLWVGQYGGIIGGGGGFVSSNGLQAAAPRVATPEEVAAQQARQQRANDEYRRICSEQEAQRAKAKAVAEELLIAHLDKKQRHDLHSCRFFEISSKESKRVYRVKYGWGGNIEVFEGGRLTETMCIHSSIYVPEADNMLAQKLLLEADEKQFRKIANITRHAA